MHGQFYFNEYHLSSTIISLVNYLVFGYVIFWVYRTNVLKPKLWKALIAVLMGLFVFSINFNFDNYHIVIPILPVGLWILLWICKHNGNEERWAKYRRFAWAGFLIRYFFLITSLLQLLIEN
ncbi:hypothetical protein ACFCYN_09895 [Gottfriedia sp. NPDC056225]|uniref:hypothetical protein n=1 Tax=Gottfriedia sp. NPDC056225 TaxID=3345751 RepID=UPI0035D81830